MGRIMKSLTQFISESQTKRFVDIVLINSESEILVLRRANYMKNFRGMWGVVGGSIEANEDSEEAAYREVMEETGVTKDSISDMKRFDEVKHKNGSISEIYIANLNKDFDKTSIKISREHAQYKWIKDTSEIKGKWMPDIKEVLDKIV